MTTRRKRQLKNKRPSRTTSTDGATFVLLPHSKTVPHLLACPSNHTWDRIASECHPDGDVASLFELQESCLASVGTLGARVWPNGGHPTHFRVIKPQVSETRQGFFCSETRLGQKFSISKLSETVRLIGRLFRQPNVVLIMVKETRVERAGKVWEGTDL